MWFQKLFARNVNYIWDYDNKGQDEAEKKPPGVSGQDKYEINVSKNGRHIFATDGTVRTYTDSQIRDLVLLFREKFPESEGYRIVVDRFANRSVRQLSTEVQAAVDGKFVKTKDKNKVKDKIKEAFENETEGCGGVNLGEEETHDI